MVHRCKERERLTELQSVVGQAAYQHYADWMRAKKRSVPPIETFGASTYYNSFIRFAEFARTANIPNTTQFIKLMVEHGDILPTLWCRDNIYSMYLKWYDQCFPPEVQVLESLEFMKELLREYQTTADEIFKLIPEDTLTGYIKRRRLSPWFLMSSKVFRKFLTEVVDPQKTQLEHALNLGAMIQLIQQEKGLFELFNRVTKAEGF